MLNLARDITPEPVSWVMEGYIARRIVTMIASPRSSGKSLVGTWLGAEVSTGGPLASGRQGRVWINSLEDHLASVVRPRLEVAGADLSRVVLTAEPWRFPQDLGALRARLTAPPADLVILDSLQQHVPRFQAYEPCSDGGGGKHLGDRIRCDHRRRRGSEHVVPDRPFDAG